MQGSISSLDLDSNQLRTSRVNLTYLGGFMEDVKCTRCACLYPNTELFFYMRKDRPGKFNYSECKKCFKARIANRAREQKAFCLEYKGGKCQECGYSKCIGALEFHHTDPSTKEFGIAKNFVCRERLIKELEKCKLLCSNCHREAHEAMLIH